MKKTLASLIVLAALVLPTAAAAAPPLTVTPDPVAVPKATIGFSSDLFTVELRNDEAESVFVQGFSLSGADAAEFGIQGYTCGFIAPGETCKFSLWFAPTSAGTKQAALSLTLYERGTQEIPLEGQAVPPQLTWSPAEGDFGLQWVDRGESRSFQLQNTGEAPVYFNGPRIAGVDDDNFWINEESCSGSSGSVLEPGQSCWVQVYFQPREVRAYEAELFVTASGAEFGAELRGGGGRAELVPSSSPLDLGGAAVGGPGELRTVTLTNQGNLPGSFFIAVVAGGDSGSFELVAEDCSGFEPVAPATSCTAQVRFKPQSPGPKEARLAMFGEGDGGTMILLKGEGVPAQVSLGANALEFGDQEAGTRSAVRTLLVSNDGSTAAAVDRVGLAGADPDQFLIAGEECGEGTLAPGESCAVRVRFAPDSAGAKSAKLKVAGGFGALSATLTGTGSAAGSVTVAASGQPASAAGPKPRRFRRNATIHAPKRTMARRSSVGQRSAERERKRERGTRR